MIKNIKYSVTFPTNGISLNGDLSLQPGVTAIVGDNGNGKTFGSIEMVRYLLFGKKALRGPATDYKKLVASMHVTIGDETYLIERSAKSERLTDSTEAVLAVGAEAVSQRIIEILGFGLDVFDVVCASVQKESDRLSKMLPTARKRLIDEVIGLSSNEAVEKACREEMKGLRREADALSDNLSPVTAPSRPEAYRKSSEIKAELEAAKAHTEKVRQLQLITNGVGPEPEPVPEPEGCLADLVEHEQNRRRLGAEIAAAQAELDRIPVTDLTEEDIVKAEALNEYTRELKRRGERPALTLAEAEEIIEAWEHRALLQKIGSTEVTCPSCEHTFSPGTDLPAEPAWPLAVAKQQQRANQIWVDDLTPPAECEPLTASQISEARRALARGDDRIRLQAVINNSKELDDRSAELEQCRKELAEHNAYNAALVRYVESTNAASAARVQLEALPVLVADIDALDRAYVEARIYETQLDSYAAAQKVFDETTVTIAAKVDKANAFKKGAEALISVRQTVKAHLAPSLSRVSSSLIHQMSGGVFSAMVVDEDMNVTVDGQDIATLSGAGSTVANLALRLALGQVLVRNIFPVFIADEADADLSDSRAQFTAECLSNLKGQLNQIIVITHKEVTTADHIITR